MLSLLVAAIGFSCLTPGLAIATIGTVGIQPAIPLFALYCIVFPLSGLRLPLQALLWALANIAGFLVSSLFVTTSGHAEHFQFVMFESFYYIAAAIGFGTVLIEPSHRRSFVNGYMAAALISSVLGISQAVISETMGIFLPLTNNENFSLVVPIGRATAFTPEASVLAGLLLPALMCVWFERGKPGSMLWAPLRGRLALLLLVAALVATRSSTLLLLPAVLLITTLFSARDWRGFFASSARILVPVALAGFLFYPLYQARLQGGDDAEWSQAWRTLKISTGLKIFEENPIFGAGPGYVSDAASFSRYLQIPRSMAWMSGQPQKGVDSTPVRIIAEGGALGVLLAYYPLIVFWRRARVAAQMDGWRPLFSLALPLIFAQTVALGYRDLLALLLPLVLFAVAGGNIAGAGLWAKCPGRSGTSPACPILVP